MLRIRTCPTALNLISVSVAVIGEVLKQRGGSGNLKEEEEKNGLGKMAAVAWLLYCESAIFQQLPCL